MKVLITGGSGFIGSHLINRLIDEQVNVVVLDHSTSLENHFHHNIVKFYHIDITDPNIAKIFDEERPEIVFHLAAQVSVANSMKDPAIDANINILGTINVLQNAVKYKVKKFIFASSAAVYGTPKYLPVDEHHPLSPTSFYGLSKVIGEKYIQLYGELFHLDYCILRFSNVYGPGQTTDGEAGVISIFLQRLKDNLPLIIYGDGTQTRDFIFVKDVADACLSAMTLPGSHIINISGNEKFSLNELVQILMEQFGTTILTKYQPSKAGDILHSCLQNQLASDILRWTKQYSIIAGLKETYEHAEKIK